MQPNADPIDVMNVQYAVDKVTASVNSHTNDTTAGSLDALVLV